MSRAVLAAALALVMALPSSCRQREAAPGRFTVEVINGHTPVKDQGRSESCWAYAMLSAIETEHIMRGDSVHLSVDYAIRMRMADEFRRCYLGGGAGGVATRGTAMTLVATIMRHGIVPYDAYSRHSVPSAAVLARKLSRTAAMAARRRMGLECSDGLLKELLDESLGHTPPAVHMYGATYSPQEFARSVCAPGEYVALTSFTHHPFYSDFALEVPDNVERSLFHNVPLDTLVSRMERAVRAGRGVCWEGDVSEPGFSFARGVARMPQGAAATQADRQRAFERFDTTDDHCMAVVGLARDARGGLFFIMKNSWGTANPYGGMVYVSENYVRMKTIAVVMPGFEF